MNMRCEKISRDQKIAKVREREGDATERSGCEW